MYVYLVFLLAPLFTNVGIFLLTFLVLGLIGWWSIYTLRFDYRWQLDHLRQQISNDLHDDIGSALCNMAMLTALMKQRLTNADAVSTFLSRMEEEIQYSEDSLSDIVWSINPHNDSLKELLIRIEMKKIKGEIDFPTVARTLRIDMEKLRQLLLLFKEALHNLAKHSACSHATIAVKLHQGRLKLRVTDNGKGFKIDELKNSGNGLRTIRERASKLEALCAIESSPGKGTAILVEFEI